MMDVIIIFVLTALVGLAIWSMVKRKKAGGGCGCGCAGCSKVGMCHLQSKGVDTAPK